MWEIVGLLVAGPTGVHMDEKEDAMLEMALPETIEVGLCFAFFSHHNGRKKSCFQNCQWQVFVYEYSYHIHYFYLDSRSRGIFLG